MDTSSNRSRSSCSRELGALVSALVLAAAGMFLWIAIASNPEGWNDTVTAEFSPDGKHLLRIQSRYSSDSNSVTVFDIESGRSLGQRNIRAFWGAFLPGGMSECILLVPDLDRKIRRLERWNFETGIVSHGPGADVAAVSANGSLTAFGSGEWMGAPSFDASWIDPNTWETIKVLKPDPIPETVRANRWLWAAASADGTFFSAQLTGVNEAGTWDWAGSISEKSVVRSPARYSTEAIIPGATGLLIATGHWSREIFVLDNLTGVTRDSAPLPGDLRYMPRLGASPGGSLVGAIRERSVGIYSLEGGTLELIDSATVENAARWLVALQIDERGDVLLADWGGSVWRWDRSEGLAIPPEKITSLIKRPSDLRWILPAIFLVTAAAGTFLGRRPTPVNEPDLGFKIALVSLAVVMLFWCAATCYKSEELYLLPAVFACGIGFLFYGISIPLRTRKAGAWAVCWMMGGGIIAIISAWVFILVMQGLASV